MSLSAMAAKSDGRTASARREVASSTLPPANLSQRDPVAPSHSRVGSSRPQSHRYLKETLQKLGEDAERLERQNLSSEDEYPARLRQMPVDSPEPEPTRPATSCSLPGETPHWTRGTIASPEPEPAGANLYQSKVSATTPPRKVDLDLWRNSFCAEAWECVRAMQAVVDGASAGHFAARFEDWRKTDLKATAQVQQHVKELSRLNQAIEEFLTKSATPEEFGSFGESLVVLRQASTDLIQTRTEISANVDVIAERCATRVMKTWAADMRSAVSQRQEFRESQLARWASDDERWTQISERLDKLQGCVERLCDDIGRQSQQIDDFKEEQAQALETTRSTAQSAAVESGEKAQAAATTLAASIREVVTAGHAATQRHVSMLLVGLEESDPLSQWMTRISDRMDKLEALGQNETKSLREQVADLQSRVETHKDEIRQLRSDGSEASRLAASLQEQSEKYSSDLERTKQLLDEASTVSLCNGLRKFKEVELRGNIKLNRQTGDLKLLRPPEFAPFKGEPGDTPAAELKDPEAAAKTLEDLQEVAQFFETPVFLDVNVYPSKNVKADLCKQQAEGRATALNELVAQTGTEGDKLRVVAHAPEGRGNTGFVVRLNRDLFTEEAGGKANFRATRTGTAGKS